MTHLPDDILYMICTQLWHQQDFDTLFNCACSGKQLAAIAITNLYRIQVATPPSLDTVSDEEILARDRLDIVNHAHTSRVTKITTIFMKCARLWRTIILSSLGKTLYPYSRYIRTLNLQDLEELLTRHEGRNEDFFQGELAQFKVYQIEDEVVQTEVGAAMNNPRQLDVVESTNRIGEAITKETPLLEELTGKVLSASLSRWIPRLPRLTRLEPWQGAANMDNGTLIRSHCLSFKGLCLRDWHTGTNDYGYGLVAFLNELRPQSLESCKILRDDSLGPEIFQALSCHGMSLLELKIDVFVSPIPKILLLKGCTNLVSLSLAGKGLQTIDLGNPYNDALLETIAWLKKCKKLRNLAVTGFYGADVIAPIFLEKNIHLTSLNYECFEMQDNRKFYQALASHTSLQSLWLKGFADEDGWDNDVLVNFLCKLVNLTHLRLKEISDSFVDRHIVQLAGSLPKLELLWTGGGRLSDAIWGGLATLRSLQRLAIFAAARFTTQGTVDFIKKLGPGNKGLDIWVTNVDMYDDFFDYEELDTNCVDEAIAERIEGSFCLVMSADKFSLA